MQVVYPTEVLRLMGLRRSYLFASMQRTLTSTYVGLQCLPLLDFTLCFELLTFFPGLSWYFKSLNLTKKSYLW